MTSARYDLDLAHSQLGFSVRHLLITRVHGVFATWTGTFELDDDAPERSKLHVDIDAATVDTRNPQRDGHLRSPDFFDTAAHPRIAFTSTQVAANGAELRITGNLTMKGVTRPVTFLVARGGPSKDSQGRARLGFSAAATIKRSEFGVSWSAAYEPNVPVVSDEVELALDLQLIPA